MKRNKSVSNRLHPNYTQEVKNSLVKRMLPPESKPVKELSIETGISKTALYYWFKTATNTTPTEYEAAKPKNDWITLNIDNIGSTHNQETSIKSGITIEIGKASINIKSDFDKSLFLEVAKTLGELC